MTQEREQKIRERAYQIWEQEGRPHNRREENWRQAEEELQGQEGGTDPSGEQTAPMSQQSDAREGPAEEGQATAKRPARKRAAADNGQAGQARSRSARVSTVGARRGKETGIP